MFNLTAVQLNQVATVVSQGWRFDAEQEAFQDEDGNLFAEFSKLDTSTFETEKRYAYLRADGGFEILSSTEYVAVRNAIAA